jgi:hypothetical protein
MDHINNNVEKEPDAAVLLPEVPDTTNMKYTSLYIDSTDIQKSKN